MVQFVLAAHLNLAHPRKETLELDIGLKETETKIKHKWYRMLIIVSYVASRAVWFGKTKLCSDNFDLYCDMIHSFKRI